MLSLDIKNNEIKLPDTWTLITATLETPTLVDGDAKAHYCRINSHRFCIIYTEWFAEGAFTLEVIPYTKEEWSHLDIPETPLKK